MAGDQSGFGEQISGRRQTCPLQLQTNKQRKQMLCTQHIKLTSASREILKVSQTSHTNLKRET
jgi:hypothetical protein